MLCQLIKAGYVYLRPGQRQGQDNRPMVNDQLICRFRGREARQMFMDRGRFNAEQRVKAQGFTEAVHADTDRVPDSRTRTSIYNE
jgi:hypothetical protein